MGFIQGQKIYYGPSEKRFELTVYGIVEPKEQERLLGLARRASQEQKISGIEIIFYPKEKFEVKTINNKVVSKKRIPQIPLRTEKIN